MNATTKEQSSGFFEGGRKIGNVKLVARFLGVGQHFLTFQLILKRHGYRFGRIYYVHFFVVDRLDFLFDEWIVCAGKNKQVDFF